MCKVAYLRYSCGHVSTQAYPVKPICKNDCLQVTVELLWTPVKYPCAVCRLEGETKPQGGGKGKGKEKEKDSDEKHGKGKGKGKEIEV
jgi:hypothetical protein